MLHLQRTGFCCAANAVKRTVRAIPWSTRLQQRRLTVPRSTRTKGPPDPKYTQARCPRNPKQFTSLTHLLAFGRNGCIDAVIGDVEVGASDACMKGAVLGVWELLPDRADICFAS